MPVNKDNPLSVVLFQICTLYWKNIVEIIVWVSTHIFIQAQCVKSWGFDHSTTKSGMVEGGDWGCCNTKMGQKVATMFCPGQNVVIAVKNVIVIF